MAYARAGHRRDVWVQGAQARQAVEVLDVLGHRMGGGTMLANSPLRLSVAGAKSVPEVYMLRSGQLSYRQVVK